MSRPGIAALAIAAAFAAGCADDQRPSTTESTPTLQLLEVSFGSACSIKTVRGLANSEYPTTDQKKVSNLVKLLDGGTPTQKVAAGFGLLDLLSKDLINNALPSTHTAANASSLTIATTNCIPNAVTPGVSDLSKAFLTNGLFVARGLGGAVTEDAAHSRDGDFAAVQAPTADLVPRNFYAWLGNGPSVIFGWPIFSSTPEEFRFGEAPVGVGYQLYAISKGQFSGETGLVALCVGAYPSKLRLQHFDKIQEAIDPSLIQGWENRSSCGTPPTQLSFGKRLLKAGFDLISPPPLLAGATVGSGTGSKSLSPFGAVDAGSVHLSLTCLDGCSTPANGTVGLLTPAPKVKATGDAGSPLPGVTIKLTVAGNSGSFKVCGPNTVNNITTVLTDADGFADFTGTAIDKPGGYTMTATSDYAGFAPAQVTSSLFTLQNGSFVCQ
jgi:hypothetical protein